MSRHRIPALLAGLLFLTLCAQLFYRQHTRGQRVRPPTRLMAVGDTLPAIQLRSLHNDDILSLESIAERGCGLIYFFDPACPACKTSAPTWSDSNRVTPSAFPTMHWVSVTSEPALSRSFLDAYALSPPAFVTAEAFPRRLGIPGVPTLWLVHDGVVRQILQGATATTPNSVQQHLCES